MRTLSCRSAHVERSLPHAPSRGQSSGRPWGQPSGRAWANPAAGRGRCVRCTGQSISSGRHWVRGAVQRKQACLATPACTAPPLQMPSHLPLPSRETAATLPLPATVFCKNMPMVRPLICGGQSLASPHLLHPKPWTLSAHGPYGARCIPAPPSAVQGPRRARCTPVTPNLQLRTAEACLPCRVCLTAPSHSTPCRARTRERRAVA
jgi:hypothetical protein